MKLTWIPCCIFLALVSLSARASAITPESAVSYFAIRDVKGEVLYWHPWSAKWRTLKSDRKLPKNTLVQVGIDSSFGFETLAPAGRKTQTLKAEKFVVQVKQPMVLRLSDDIFRQISFNPFFIDQLPGLQESASSQKGIATFKEAWERLVAVVSGKLPVNQVLSREAGIDLGIKSKKIKLYMPPRDSIFLVKSFPMKMEIRWQDIPENGAEFEVNLWKKGSESGPPVAKTRSNRQVVSIADEGSYMYQVSTSDGKWQSAIAQTHVSFPVGQFTAEKNSKINLSERKTPNPLLPIYLPPPDFAYLVKKLPVKIDFTWERTESVPDYAPFNFIIVDHLGKEFLNQIVNGTSTSAHFKEPGDYYWYVEATVPKKPGEQLTPENSRDSYRVLSQARKISIISKSRETLARQSSDDILSYLVGDSFFNGIVYIDN